MLEAELDILEVFNFAREEEFDTATFYEMELWRRVTPTEIEGILWSFSKVLKWEYENTKEILKWRLGLKRDLEINTEWELKNISRFKTKVYVNGDTVKRIQILKSGEVNVKNGNAKFYYSLARIGVKLLRKAKRNWDIAIGKVLSGDRLEFLIRDIYFEGYFNELFKLKQNLNQLIIDNKFPIWQILYFRPKWIGEVSRGILLYYLSPNITKEDRQLMEEYYLRFDYDELTPDEKLLKEVIEKRGRDLEMEYYPYGDIVEIPLSEEIIEKLKTKALEKGLGRLEIEKALAIPKWKFEDYLRFSPQKDLVESLLDLMRLKELHKDIALLREDIVKDRLLEKNYTRPFNLYPY